MTLEKSQRSGVAQRKRGGPINHRSQGRNLAPLLLFLIISELGGLFMQVLNVPCDTWTLSSLRLSQLPPATYNNRLLGG